MCKDAAPEVDLYERTVLLVDVDPERFYIVDLFAVNGGEQRDQSWHGPLAGRPDNPVGRGDQPLATVRAPDPGRPDNPVGRGHLLFSTGHPDDDGKLTQTRHLYFAGSRLGEGEVSRAVRGTWRSSSTTTKIFLEQPAQKSELEQCFGGKTISLWQYGAGDSVELARVVAATEPGMD